MFLGHDDPVFVVVLFDGSRQGPAHADAVAAHDQGMFLSVHVQIGGMEGFTVFGVQFEHLAHFDAPGFLQMAVTMGAFVPGHGGADVCHLGVHEIPGGFRIHIVDVLFVGPAAHIVHVHDGMVDEDDGLVLVKPMVP